MLTHPSANPVASERGRSIPRVWLAAGGQST